MQSHLEKRLQQDIDNIRNKVIEMSELVEIALKAALESINRKSHLIAYSVILRDKHIDKLEKELDQLCQEFLIRQQPAAGSLRFVYSVIKINTELERIGDYAETISRLFLKVHSLEPELPNENIIEMANISIAMLRNAVQSFIDQDTELAIATMKKYDTANKIRYNVNHNFVEMYKAGKLHPEAVSPLMIMANRFERVADRACNICEEVMYICTGKDIKHDKADVTMILFVDELNACRAQIAEGIGNSLDIEGFQFSSAGISPKPIDSKTVQFMKEKGFDISKHESKYLNQIIHLEHYDVIIALCEEATKAFPSPPTETVSMKWDVEDPSKIEGSDEEVLKAYEKTFQYLVHHIRDLVEAILGKEPK